ncbi:hypothetical protein S1001342_01350 [Acetobacter pasteurianus subsp. pasteurianus]|uniref:Uncharacterized protein n=1 Tax=Acetobacter pasteurianus subsp. pasteurianus TaxID=481145 RepID=A0A1Y0XXR3_ACEPA|nr:hypothetical protein DB34_04740 [Acetobacter pasteurianus]ARW47680.1 hypothetical protein S1001342_01350 [Acetobacter pasteurianus subsp. pasteurianus]
MWSLFVIAALPPINSKAGCKSKTLNKKAASLSALQPLPHNCIILASLSIHIYAYTDLCTNIYRQTDIRPGKRGSPL